MKHLQRSDWKVGLPWFSYGCWTCMFVGFLNWIHMSSQLCSLFSVEWLFMCEDIVQSLLNMCFFMMFALWSSHSKALHRVPILMSMPMPTHTHGLWVGMGAMLLFMGGHMSCYGWAWVGIGRCWWLWSGYGYKFGGKCWALSHSHIPNQI
jgi:hypothetical protein